ncbi:Striated Muscle Preferentially Expressed Protein Kinase [Manis pentadactyla]|nr:Striated Muscle Preferentially Expressed Protein Kinase [Manis pentadactyla]
MTSSCQRPHSRASETPDSSEWEHRPPEEAQPQGGVEIGPTGQLNKMEVSGVEPMQVPGVLRLRLWLFAQSGIRSRGGAWTAAARNRHCAASLSLRRAGGVSPFSRSSLEQLTDT